MKKIYTNIVQGLRGIFQDSVLSNSSLSSDTEEPSTTGLGYKEQALISRRRFFCPDELQFAPSVIALCAGISGALTHDAPITTLPKLRVDGIFDTVAARSSEFYHALAILTDQTDDPKLFQWLERHRRHYEVWQHCSAPHAIKDVRNASVHFGRGPAHIVGGVAGTGLIAAMALYVPPFLVNGQYGKAQLISRQQFIRKFFGTTGAAALMFAVYTLFMSLDDQMDEREALEIRKKLKRLEAEIAVTPNELAKDLFEGWSLKDIAVHVRKIVTSAENLAHRRDPSRSADDLDIALGAVIGAGNAYASALDDISEGKSPAEVIRIMQLIALDKRLANNTELRKMIEQPFSNEGASILAAMIATYGLWAVTGNIGLSDTY